MVFKEQHTEGEDTWCSPQVYANYDVKEVAYHTSLCIVFA